MKSYNLIGVLLFVSIILLVVTAIVLNFLYKEDITCNVLYLEKETIDRKSYLRIETEDNIYYIRHSIYLQPKLQDIKKIRIRTNLLGGIRISCKNVFDTDCISYYKRP